MFKDFIKNEKLRNPYFWLAMFALVFSAGGVDFQTLTSWKLLFEAIVQILNNPVSCVAIITAMLGIWNDNSSKGLDKIKMNKKQE